MQKRYAMSNMGYAIIFVIVLGIIMIISTPMIIDSYKSGNKNNQQNISERRYDEERQNEELRQTREKRYRDNSFDNDANMINLSDKINSIEINFDSRIRTLEQQQRELLENNNSARERVQNPQEEVSDKFVCTIEGNLDSEGNLVPIDSKSSAQTNRRQKIVFVCDYKE